MREDKGHKGSGNRAGLRPGDIKRGGGKEEQRGKGKVRG